MVRPTFPAVKIGHRHLPSMQVVQNVRQTGADTSSFRSTTSLALRHGSGRAGRCLIGTCRRRGISLPSLSAAGAAYPRAPPRLNARIREQFGISHKSSNSRASRAARPQSSATAITARCARRRTCAALNAAFHPASSRIMKLARDRVGMRTAIDDRHGTAMAAAVIDGPQNYLAICNRAVPVGITWRAPHPDP